MAGKKISMEAIIIIMLVSLTVALGFLVSFLVSVRSGQYQDMVSPSITMLIEPENSGKSTTLSDPLTAKPMPQHLDD